VRLDLKNKPLSSERKKWSAWVLIDKVSLLLVPMRIFLLPLFLITAIHGFAAEAVLKFTITKPDGLHAYQLFIPDAALADNRLPSSEEEVQQQHNAGVASLSWAKQFYGAREIYLRSVELKEAPVAYYLAKFDGEVAGARQVFFAVVLISGSVLEPIEVPPGGP
jgi:hypothetical protein